MLLLNLLNPNGAKYEANDHGNKPVPEGVVLQFVSIRPHLCLLVRQNRIAQKEDR